MYIIWLPITRFASAWKCLELQKNFYFVDESLLRLDIMRRIFQGDGLYPLLFVPWVVPPNIDLQKSESWPQIEQMKV